MENKFNFGSFLIGIVVVLIMLIPNVVKLTNTQKEQTLKEFAEYKPDKPLIKGEPLKTINDTINDVFVTEYLHYRCTMILNPSRDNPNEVLIYIQDRKNCVTVPLHTTLNERYNWDSLKVHSTEFTKRSIEVLFE